MADLVQYYGTGRRKSSIARVFLRPGSGNFTVNRKEFDVYFVTAQQRAAAKRLAGHRGHRRDLDVVTTVRGGGVMGQADAVKLGIARALMEFNPELRKTLKAEAWSPATRVVRSARSTARRAHALASSSRSDKVFSSSCCCLVLGLGTSAYDGGAGTNRFAPHRP